MQPVKTNLSRVTANRRNFIKSTAAATAVIAVPMILPARLLGSVANDRVRVGSIGTSIYSNRYTGDGDHPGRGAVVGHQAGKLGDMVAVADVNRRNAEFFAKRYKDNCRVYNDYQALLARDDIDAVTIGTPDHWHAKIAIDAMRAGKHVYCEKPLSLDHSRGPTGLQGCRRNRQSFPSRNATAQRVQANLFEGGRHRAKRRTR